MDGDSKVVEAVLKTEDKAVEDDDNFDDGEFYDDEMQRKPKGKKLKKFKPAIARG